MVKQNPPGVVESGGPGLTGHTTTGSGKRAAEMLGNDDIDATTLHAYVDGQLDPALRHRVLEAMRRDARRSARTIKGYWMT